MIQTLSPNTQAILLLTAPLFAANGSVSSSELLSPSEYKRLARHLLEIQRQPADLTLPDATEILHACNPVIDEHRLQKLLGRGFLLSQAIDRWQTRAIWVVSRADTEYPRRLKARLREDAPAVLYGCGDLTLLETGGLAVVGSRHVDDSLVDYTMSIGRVAANAKSTIISGGAKGIDQAAMRGALDAGGKVCGVLADRLERTAMKREHRNFLLDGQMVLISPYDPNAGFNVGNAMQRNKLIYALSDAALIVNSDLKKGGTWAGAVEQLDKLRLVPVFLRSTGSSCSAFDALREKGAHPWPNQQDSDSFKGVFDANVPLQEQHHAPTQMSLLGEQSPPQNRDVSQDEVKALNLTEGNHSTEVSTDMIKPGFGEIRDKLSSVSLEHETEPLSKVVEEHNSTLNPAEMIFAAVNQSIQMILTKPMKDAEVAAALDVSNSQAKIWLQRLVEDGVVKKAGRPVKYVLRGPNFFLGNKGRQHV